MKAALIIAAFVIALLIALSIYLWRKPAMDTKPLTDKIEKLTTDAKSVGAVIAAKDSEIAQLKADKTALQDQITQMQAAEDAAVAALSADLDQLDAALPDALGG